MVLRFASGGSNVSEGAQFWWEAPTGEKHLVLAPLVERLRQQDQARRERVLRYMRMYGNYTGAMAGAMLEDSRLRYNIVGEFVDTAVAEVTFTDPKAAFIATGGDWTLRQAAKQSEQLCDATLRDCGFYKGLARMIARDSAITGWGCVIVEPDWTELKPRIDRLLPLEVLCEEADSRAGRPRGIFVTLPYDRGVLAAENPKFARQILDRELVPRWQPEASGGVADWLIQDSRDSDLVLVTRAWRLPARKDGSDGRYVCSVQGLDLVDEPYLRKRFPLVWMPWQPDLTGIWGIGVAQAVQADQIEINRTLIQLQDSVGAAAGHWLLQRGSKINPRKLHNLPGGVIEYDSIKPDYVQPNTFPSDLVAHIDRVVERARRRVGVSEMVAAGQKPMGLQSGEAIRSSRDQFSMRQSPHSKQYESWTVDVAEAVVDCWHEIYEYVTSDAGQREKLEMPEVPVELKRGRRTVLKRMRWGERGETTNEWVIKAYPMSALPNHPSSRSATVAEWLAGGIINAEEARFLLEMPDTEGHLQLALADHDFALFAFETMTEDGEYVPPEPYQKLELALELVRRAYLRARIDGCPDERLDLVRDHMAEIDRLMKKAAAKAAAEAAKAQAAAAAQASAQLPAQNAPMPAPMAGATEIPPGVLAA